jgi:hypothetical protein
MVLSSPLLLGAAAALSLVVIVAQLILGALSVIWQTREVAVSTEARAPRDDTEASA